MPYIKLVDRTKFSVPIMDALNVLKDPNDTPYLKAEYFGFFVNRLVRRFLIDPDYTANSFNSYHFNEGKKKTLIQAADSLSAAINRADPIATAGELNYSITAVLWGFLGDAEGFVSVGYGMRTLMRGVIEKINQSIETVNSGSQKDMAMAFRRHLIIRGVLADIVTETYRLKTIPYEELKIAENGHVWKDGKLVLLEIGTSAVQ